MFLVGAVFSFLSFGNIKNEALFCVSLKTSINNFLFGKLSDNYKNFFLGGKLIIFQVSINNFPLGRKGRCEKSLRLNSCLSWVSMTNF